MGKGIGCLTVGIVRINSNWLASQTTQEDNLIPCSKKILREFYVADWRVFVVCGNKFLRFEMTKIFAGN